jgi:hypothetical protein
MPIWGFIAALCFALGFVFVVVEGPSWEWPLLFAGLFFFVLHAIVGGVSIRRPQ